LAVIAQVCAAVRQGTRAVLLVGIPAEQLQAFFPLTPQTHTWTDSAWPASVSPPGAAVGWHDAHPAAASPPRSHALWVQASKARGEAETRWEEFALLLEEAALLLEATVLAMGTSHQLLDKSHA
jgi:hypothetical protein